MAYAGPFTVYWTPPPTPLKDEAEFWRMLGEILVQMDEEAVEEAKV